MDDIRCKTTTRCGLRIHSHKNHALIRSRRLTAIRIYMSTKHTYDWTTQAELVDGQPYFEREIKTPERSKPGLAGHLPYEESQVDKYIPLLNGRIYHEKLHCLADDPTSKHSHVSWESRCVCLFTTHSYSKVMIRKI